MPAAASDPIVARATPPGAAPRAVVRLSGRGLLAEPTRWLPAGFAARIGGRGAYPGRWGWAPDCGPSGEVDCELLVFPGPASATGEDVLELHLPGAAPVVDAVYEQLLARGARPAEPGEFTRRAFLNGRMDLTQAEAVLALVCAGGRAEAQAAAGLLRGALSDCMQRTRDLLQAALVEVEAGLDFEEGDSQDLEPGAIDALLDRAGAALRDGIEVDAKARAEDRASFRIGLLGPPNAGKTALVAKLSGAPGLVSDEAGTTRDWRASAWRIDGLDRPCELLDGPGLGGQAVDPRDRAARDQAGAALPQVDLWWCCNDPADPAAPPPPPQEAPRIQVWTKADLGRSPGPPIPGLPAVQVSAADDAGLAELAALSLAVLRDGEAGRAAVQAGSERHQAALRDAEGHIQRARRQLEEGDPQDLIAEELRLALHALAALVGAWTPEDLLDRLFARFCVGK